jgi:DNA-directed DNA polymerase III PolC
MPVIPLRVHSHWSLLDGVPSIAEIVDQARQLNLPAIALTDTNALYGALEFVRRCHEAGLQPIIGVDFTLNAHRSVRLLARNLIGYANLCRLVTRLQSAADREASLARGLTLSDLAVHTDGLLALADGPTARELIDLFGPDQVFVELETADRALQTLADQLGVRTVAAPDIRYLAPEDAPRYRVLAAMRTGQRITAIAPLLDYAFPSEEVMRQRFAEFPQALTNTELIADRCHFDFPLGQLRFPTLDLPAGLTPRDMLQSQVWSGAHQRYGAITPDIEARLRKEIDVIDTLGYTPYFLVVADIVRFAREQGVPVSPRGSASSSVVAYCLGIHDVDPIAHNLYFERFLSLERHDPPDIDLDLCSHRRDEVINYVYRKYGAVHVAMVCTYATLQPRSALREVCKVYGLSEARIKALAEHLPQFWQPGRRNAAQEAQAELIQRAHDPIEREALEMSQALTGTPHHLSIHPGGIVIAPDPITDLVPLQYATKGLLITQFDLNGIEQLGLIKIDLLGISALTVVADCVEFIRRREPQFSIDQIPLDDAPTARTLSSAQTIGCFQTESPGMRFTLRELATQNIDDLIAALALYRPGPLKGGLKDAFVRRHLGQEAAEYLHPALEPILRETYGVILYQEQVLRIAHEVAGFTLGEADMLRRAMSKFRSAHEMERLRAQFVDGAQSTNNIDAAIAEQIWDLMAAFAGYGFPKAHAAGYAAVAYRMAYLKTHFPAEFFAARLAVWGGFYSPRVYMSEARHLGLSVKPPHVNHSREAFTLDPDDRITLWMGLGQVRDLTYTTVQTIIEQQPFTAFDDFLIRARPLYVEAINLIKAGALEGLGQPHALLEKIEQARWHGRHTAQLSLMSGDIAPSSRAVSIAEHAAWEREVLGTLVSVHPLQLIGVDGQRPLIIQSHELSQHLDQAVTLAGVRLAAHRFRAASQESMLLVDMEDRSGGYQVLWSGAVLRDERVLLNQREPVLIRGRVRRDRRGQLVVVGSQIESL